ncbi:DUF6615 family protein [Myroides fluvii]|uniref:DUF6615 family protein n=1 Tax=Myroides fluvii TaxID=2572594 RepID=UPI00131D4166|nr:DUF6615 family protein [Myroides fluvii]
MISNINYKKDAEKNDSSASLIKYVSVDVYNRIGFVHNKKDSNFSRMGEVTLTENLIYELHKFEDETKLKFFKIFESEDEKTNGADLILDFPIGDQYISIPIQAKKLTVYKNNKEDGSYKCFVHNNKNGLQSELLKEYSKNLGSNLPLYLLYNYTSNSPNLKKSNDAEELFGCSVMNINTFTNNQKTVKFSDLHTETAIPFYKLFDFFDRIRKKGNSGPDGPDGSDGPKTPMVENFEILKEFYKLFGISLEKKDLEEIKLNDIAQIFTKENKSYIINNGSKDETIFNPRYRIVLLSEPQSPKKDNNGYVNTGAPGKNLGDYEYTDLTKKDKEIDQIESKTEDAINYAF